MADELQVRECDFPSKKTIYRVSELHRRIDRVGPEIFTAQTGIREVEIRKQVNCYFIFENDLTKIWSYIFVSLTSTPSFSFCKSLFERQKAYTRKPIENFTEMSLVSTFFLMKVRLSFSRQQGTESYNTYIAQFHTWEQGILRK